MKFVFLLFLPLVLRADGGKVILTGTNLGETITVFADPFPLRANQSTDLSVLVQHETDPVLGGTVRLQLGTMNLQLTHQNATNKLLFVTTIAFPKSGVETLIASHDKASVQGTVEINSAPPKALSYWPYVAVVPGAIGLFALNRYLKRAREKSTWV